MAPVVSREGGEVSFLTLLCGFPKEEGRCPRMSQMNTDSSLMGTEALA